MPTLSDFMNETIMVNTKWYHALKLFDPDFTFEERANAFLVKRLGEHIAKADGSIEQIGEITGITPAMLIDLCNHPENYAVDSKLMEHLGIVFKVDDDYASTEMFFEQPNEISNESKKYFGNKACEDCFCAPSVSRQTASSMYIFLLASDALNFYSDWMEKFHGKISISNEQERDFNRTYEAAFGKD